MDAQAKANRIDAYERVRSAEDCEAVLNRGRPVVGAFMLNARAWQTALGGRILMPGTREVLKEAHSVCLLEADKARRVFHFVNSWGEAWGDKGYGTLPYAYFDKYQSEAWVGLTIHPDDRLPHDPPRGLVVRGWGLDGSLPGQKLYGVEFIDTDKDELAGWTFSQVSQGYLDIEELYVRPQYRGRGIGQQLSQRILDAPWRTDRKLRAWISHPDVRNGLSPAAIKILQRLGLTTRPSTRRWARMVGM